MNKIWENKYTDEQAYIFAPIKKPSLKEKLFNWFFCVEGVERGGERARYIAPKSLNESAHSEPTHDLNRRKSVQQALSDWKAATAYFESVSDPDLVDYAVYEMEAAQKRYIYLLRDVKGAK